MGLIIGNHDVPRFASVAMGEGDGDGWNPADPATDKAVYDKQIQALALGFTLPGAPFVYYGDEIALVGRADPDSRRVMPAPEGLSPDALRVRDTVRRLSRVRACAPALRRGDVQVVFADRERVVFSRSVAGRSALVVATRNAFGVDGLQVPVGGIPEGKYVDVLSTQTISVSSALTFLPGGPFSVHVFLPEGDPCVQ
jgi:glycosidase